MKAEHSIKSSSAVQGIPALILQPDTDRAVRQVIALWAQAKRLRPRRAACLYGAAERAIRDLADILGDGGNNAIDARANRMRFVYRTSHHVDLAVDRCSCHSQPGRPCCTVPAFFPAAGREALLRKGTTDRAAILHGWRPPSTKLVLVAWGIGSTVCSSVSASMPNAPDPENFITSSTWVPLGIMVAVLISVIVLTDKISRWAERLTNRLDALEKKGRRR